MAVKYIKDHKTQETVYPVTKSECIIDAFRINNYEIDLLFDGSPEDESSDPGMDYLNYGGLKYYHRKLLTDIESGYTYNPGDHIIIENNTISVLAEEISEKEIDALGFNLN